MVVRTIGKARQKAAGPELDQQFKFHDLLS